MKTIVAEFTKRYKSEFVQKDEQFKTDEDRIKYCLAAVTMIFSDRLPVKPYDIIPVGVGPKRVSQAGKYYSDLFVIINNRLRRIQVKSTAIPILDQITFDQKYKDILLSAFSKDPASDLSADDRAVLNRPEFVANFDLEKVVEIPQVKIRDIALSPSLTTSDGWTVRTDWKVVEAMIASHMKGGSEEKGYWGFYRISDGSGPISVGTKGQLLESITVWVAPRLMKYGAESICRFYGTISLDNDGVPSMNAYRIKPVFAKPIEEN